MNDKRAELRALFDAAVAAAHPSRCLPPHLPDPRRGRIIILAAGKAAGSMTEAAETHYLDDLGLPSHRLTGIAVARQGYGRPTRAVRMVEAAHPVPDARGLQAAREALALARSARPEDLVLALISGGGSAVWIAPLREISLDMKQSLTRTLLRSGAAIGEINTVRKHLSAIKGGRLAAAAHPAPILTLAISDVPGDDPATIASGPTIADGTTLADARAVLEKYAIEADPTVRSALDDPASESPKPGDPRLAGAEFRLIATPKMALSAAAETAAALGYRVQLLGAELEGEARDIAAAHAQLARAHAASHDKIAILSGGEATVTIRGSGQGGPNQEFALALALALEGMAGIWAIAGDTDGTDGGSGSSEDAAGAFILPDTLERAQSVGLHPHSALKDNDSTGFFTALGDLLMTGPTFTNVNDLRAVLVDTAID